MPPKSHDHVVGPEQVIRFSMGTVATILVAAFVLGSTFTTYAFKFSELSTRVDRVAKALEDHIGASVARIDCASPRSP